MPKSFFCLHYFGFKLKHQKKSQTLIEVVISIALAAMVISALLVLGAASSKTVTSSLSRSQATKLATDKIEEARFIRDNYGYANVTLPYTNGGLSLVASEIIVVGNNTFTRTIAIATLPNPPRKTITVTVSWPESSGSTNSKSISISTILSDWR